MGGWLLAFDTSAAHCAAALLRADGSVAATRLEPMAKGQAERLLPLLEEVLAEGGIGWRDLAALAVGTGPGNFTGVRIAVAAVRGLALGLGIPAIGVSGFEALGGEGLRRLPAPRGQVYVQAFRDGRAVGAPSLAEAESAASADGGVNPALRGDGAPVGGGMAALGDGGVNPTLRGSSGGVPADSNDNPALHIARVAWERLQAGDPSPRPAPLYVRPPDAAPPSDPPPVILDA